VRLLALILVSFFAGLVAKADDIPASPGWSLTKINEAGGSDDGTYDQGRTYYSLKPPDARPAVSVDARTADKLRSGEMSGEYAYGTQSGGNAQQAKKEDEEYVYGAHGIAQADPVASTLTPEEGGKDVAPAPAVAAAANHPSSSTGGSAPAPATFKTGGPEGLAASQRAPSSGASMPRNWQDATGGASQAAGNAGGGPQQVNDPRAAAVAGDKAVGGNSPTVFPALVINNVAQGFGIVGTSSSTSTVTNFSVWPNGAPGTGAKSGNCNGTAVVTKFSSNRYRITGIPSDCNYLRVKVWGGGGGSGSIVSGDDLTRPKTLRGTGANFVTTEGTWDPSKYDLVSVVGNKGGDADGVTPGKGGSPGGKDGVATNEGAGGGGGGYSAVYFVDKKKDGAGDDVIGIDMAVAAAAGGYGGSWYDNDPVFVIKGGAGGHLVPGADAPFVKGLDFFRWVDKNDVQLMDRKGRPGNPDDPARGDKGDPGKDGLITLDFLYSK
jgi:hypothetical protein